MKFKVGDKVRIIKERFPESSYLNQTGIISDKTPSEYYAYSDSTIFILWSDGGRYPYSENKIQLDIPKINEDKLRELLK